MEKDLAMKIISSRSLVPGEGKFVAKVENVNPYRQETALGRDTVAIVNFNLMTPYHRKEAKNWGSQGDYQKATNQRMSFSVLEGDYLPAKGEVVDVMVIEKDNKEGIPSLFISSIIPKKAEKLSKVSFSFDDETEGVDIAEDVPAFSTKVVHTEA